MVYLKNVKWNEREKRSGQDLPQIIWKRKEIRTGSTSRMCSQTRCRTRGSTPTFIAAKSFLDESNFELVLLVVVSLKSSPQHLTHSGLIQDENRRLVDQCHCQRKSPLLTSAQRSHLILVSMRCFLTLQWSLSLYSDADTGDGGFPYSESRFVPPVTAGCSVNFLPAV